MWKTSSPFVWTGGTFALLLHYSLFSLLFLVSYEKDVTMSRSR